MHRYILTRSHSVLTRCDDFPAYRSRCTFVAQAKIEALAEDILTDKQLVSLLWSCIVVLCFGKANQFILLSQSIDYDRKRNENRQALRAIQKRQFGILPLLVSYFASRMFKCNA